VLYNGEALEVMDKLIAEGVVVDAIITDPPYGTTACKWDSVIDFEEMWERLNKLIKPNGAIVLFGSEPFSSALRMSNIKNYKYDWVWVNKVTKQGSKITDNIGGGKRKTSYIQTHTNYPRNILEFSKDRPSTHPTQKPVALMEYLIKTYTNEGDTVLDFTMGSGSTGVACKNTNRKFIGIEMDKGYFGIAKKRIEGVINVI
jgi:DNA modification methylase